MLQEFLLNVSLLRHVGVLPISVGSELLCDVPVDVTEIGETPGVPLPLPMFAPGMPTKSQGAAGLPLPARTLQKRADAAGRRDIPFLTSA